ncbi:MAG: hypothetical protein K0S44_462 [Bacteroidetes bacterium]|jgi:hypothetical protein|nr:hypothetical protein [Bacteroidota bacterium]
MKNGKITQFSVKVSIFLSVLFITSAFTFPVHKFYLSLTEVRADTKKQTLDVSSKLFTDDLEVALQKKYGKKVDLATSSKNKDVQALLHKYIIENFKMSVAGTAIDLTFVGFETEADATWCYLESVPFYSKGKVRIVNTLLYDYLPEQSNMINFYWDQEEKTAKLVNPEKTTEFDFQLEKIIGK